MSVMKRAGAINVANRFAKLDFHDDALISITINPPHSAKNLTRIEFGFKDDATGRVKIPSFQSCANVRFVADFDVLANNWHFGNTKALAAETDPTQMRKFVIQQSSHWRTAYMPPMSRKEPVKQKLKKIRNYNLFKLAFFGGTAEILAKGYKLSRRSRQN
jgi:hypothetical protein